MLNSICILRIRDTQDFEFYALAALAPPIINELAQLKKLNCFAQHLTNCHSVLYLVPVLTTMLIQSHINLSLSKIREILWSLMIVLLLKLSKKTCPVSAPQVGNPRLTPILKRTLSLRRNNNTLYLPCCHTYH